MCAEAALAVSRPLAEPPPEVARLAELRPPAAEVLVPDARVPVVRVVVSGFRPVRLDPAGRVRFDPVRSAYVLDDDLPGTLLVIGAGHVDAIRSGRGAGDAVRSGRGSGDAVRSGAGYGNAVRSGGGRGDALRDGAGSGDALVRPDVIGNATVAGSARGTAVNLGCAGDAVNSSSSVGAARRRGPGSGDAVRSGHGAGAAFRGGAGPGSACRRGSGAGDAWRVGPGPGSACRFGSGDGHALRGGSAPGGASRLDGGRGFAAVGAGVRGVAFALTSAAQAVVFSVVGDAVAPGGAWRGALPPAPSPLWFAEPVDPNSFPDAVYRAWVRTAPSS